MCRIELPDVSEIEHHKESFVGHSCNCTLKMEAESTQPEKHSMRPRPVDLFIIG